MSVKWKVLSAAAVTSLLFAGCAKEEAKSTAKQTEKKEVKEEKKEATEMETVQAYKDVVAELDKVNKNEAVDFEKVTKLYKEKLQTLVQQRDGEFTEKIDQTITTALEAGKSKQMDPIVVRQLVDKLMQKEFFQTIRHDFKEVNEKWSNKEEAKKEYEEAVTYYKALEEMVGKRDTANGTKLKETISAGFGEVKTAIEKGDKLAFGLGKQLVDKTLMRAFYLATGDIPNGYAAKAAEEAKKDEKKAKVEQAEGWAFYQSLYSYIQKPAAAEADFILKQFDLQTDVKTMDAAAVNKAFVRGLAKVALSEYKESKEKFAEEKGAITGLEGALFIHIIEKDLKAVLGESETAKLMATAQTYVDMAKAKDKDRAEKARTEIEAALNKAVETAK